MNYTEKAEQAWERGDEAGWARNNGLADAERKAEAQRPLPLWEQAERLERQLSSLDCSLARECGTYDEVKVTALRVTLAEIRASMASAETAELLAAGWTIETTSARRAEWNGRMRQSPIKTAVQLRTREREMGYAFADLKRAIAAHKL